MEHSQVNKILSNYIIIISMTEQGEKIISTQDYLISQSGAAVSKFTRVGLNYLPIDYDCGQYRKTLDKVWSCWLYKHRKWKQNKVRALTLGFAGRI